MVAERDKTIKGLEGRFQNSELGKPSTGEEYFKSMSGFIARDEDLAIAEQAEEAHRRDTCACLLHRELGLTEFT
jgi:hypothetical protein